MVECPLCESTETNKRTYENLNKVQYMQCVVCKFCWDSPKMTMEQFKIALPKIKVRCPHTNKVLIGKISGRQLQYPQIYHKKIGSYEVSWLTALNCYNGKRAIIV